MSKSLLIAAAMLAGTGPALPQTPAKQLEVTIFTEIGGLNEELTSIQVRRGHAAAKYCAETSIAVGAGQAEAMACAAGFLRGVNWQIEGE